MGDWSQEKETKGKNQGFYFGCHTVCSDYLQAYNNLKLRLKAAYDALFPLNFDNVRGYQFLFQLAANTSSPYTLSKENLPYVQAIYQGLLNPSYGLISGLSPGWINDLRYKTLIDKQLYPPSLLPISIEGSDYVGASLKLMATTLDAGTCMYHNGVYLPAPLTYPDKNLSQIVQVPYTVTRVKHTHKDPLTGEIIEDFVSTLVGKAQGLPVAIFNNPLLEAVDLAVYKSDQGLVEMLLPDFAAKKPLERDMIAPVAELNSPDDGVTAKTEIFGVGHASVPRLGGQTHWKLCQLRNQWFMPGALQDKSLNCEKMELQDMINGNFTPDTVK